MSTARLAEPCRTLPPPCPSPARLTNGASAPSAQSALTLAPRPQQTGTLRRTDSFGLLPPAGGGREVTYARADQSAMVYVARRQRRSAGTRGSDRRSQREPSAPGCHGNRDQGPAGQLAIGGSKSGAGAKGEASFAPRPADSRTTPPDRRKGAGQGARVGLIRPDSRSPQVFSKTRTRVSF